MANKSIKLNYIYNMLYQVLILLTPLLTAPYLSRVLGAEGIGEVSYVASIASYFLLFAGLGITTYGQREIAYFQDDRQARTQAFWEIKTVSFLVTLAVILIYLPFCSLQENTAIYLVYILSLVATVLDISWMYQGMEEFGIIVLRNSLLKLAEVSFIFLFVKDRDDLLLYVLGITLINFFAHGSLWLGIGKIVGKPVWKELHPLRRVAPILSLFIPTIAIQIYTVMDKTMIGLITQSDAENGYYEQALKLSKMVLMLVTALGTVMIPRISYHFEKNDTEKVRSYMYRGYRFVWILGIPLCFGLIGVASSLVPWFFGPGYDKVVPLLQILSLLILAIGINNVTGMQYLIPTKRQNMFTLTVVIGAVVNFIANLILIYYFHSIGAAIASVLAETVIAVVQIVVVRKELSPWHIVKDSWRYWIAGGAMLAAVLLLGNAMEPTIITTMLQVAIGAVIYFALVFILRDDFFLSTAKQILDKLLKRG